MGPKHFQGSTIFRPFQNSAMVKDPDPVAVFVFHATFTLVIVGFPSQMTLQFVPALLQVIRMGIFPPGINCEGLKSLECITDDLSPSLIENSFTGLNIPLPGTRICSL